MYCIILAGGSGSRLWPLSRELYPKQLLNIQNDDSLFQETYKRMVDIIPPENIICITNTKHLSNVKYQLSSSKKQPLYLSEPIAKNTAPAISISVKYLLDNIKDINDLVVAVIPSDHKIDNIQELKKSLKKAEKIAKQGYLVSLGVKPTYPETGYGYIKKGEQIEQGVFNINKFIEKPELEDADKYYKNSEYYWNTGILLFKPSVFIDELKQYAPDIYDIISTIDLKKSVSIPYVKFERLPFISIDYALLEKSSKIALVELDSNWIDVGSWKSIYDVSKKDMDSNVKVGHILDVNSKNSLMYSSSKLVATIGLDNMIVVETEDAVLVCNKDKVQDVKQVFETLKQQHDNTQLVHKTVYRPWGFYTVLAQGDGFLTKMIHVNPKQKLSVQSHNHRSEHWVVLSGKAKVVLDKESLMLSSGHSVDIPVKAIHSLQNPYEENLEIIEVQKGDLLIEDDIIRYEDMYGRV